MDEFLHEARRADQMQIRDLAAAIERLKAEHERLREAVQDALDWIEDLTHWADSGVTDVHRDDLIYVLKAALITPEEQAAHFGRQCGRVLVGQGTDTYDPVCVLPAGHSGACRPISAWDGA